MIIFISVLISIFASIFLYRNSFSAYFFQDDWFSLWISNAKSIADFLRFFVPRSDVIYFRPLGMQTPFFILRTLFGINPLPFHILTFLTHAANIILVYILFRLLNKGKFSATLAAFLYGVSAVHYIPAFWSATYAFVLGPTFFFLSFILYLTNEKKKGKIYHYLSIITFILGLLVNEMVIVLIPILLFYFLYIKKFEWKKLLLYCYPVILIFLLRFIIFTPPTTGFYRMELGKDVIHNLKAYILWSFNLPEEIKAQFVSAFGLNSQFLREFSSYIRIFVITFFINILFFYLLPSVFAFIQKRKNFISLAVFSTGWFIAGLLPVLFFTKHSYSYYLPIALCGLIFLSVSLFTYLLNIIGPKNKLLSFLFILILVLNWTVSSAVTLDFDSKIHWVERRASISKVLIEKAKQHYPAAYLDSNYIYVQPSSEKKLSLNNQDAFKVIYDNDEIVTQYRYFIGRLAL